MYCRIRTPGIRTELLYFLAGKCPSSLLQHRSEAFLSLQGYTEMPESKAGRQAALKGSKPVKNKNLFGNKTVIFINKNISVPEGPDVSKSCFQL